METVPIGRIEIWAGGCSMLPNVSSEAAREYKPHALATAIYLAPVGAGTTVAVAVAILPQSVSSVRDAPSEAPRVKMP